MMEKKPKPHWIEAKSPPPPNPNSPEAIDERLNQWYAEIQLRKVKPYREKPIVER
jgi:hypothetical protein